MLESNHMQKLGQNFLIDKNAITKIVAALAARANEIVIEIGPGHGELTDEILRSDVTIIAVEKDAYLAKKIEEKYKNEEKFSVISGDILKELPKLSAEYKKYKLIGNVPYYLTGFLLRTIGELENKPKIIVFTLQKEVAERIAASPPKMNLLAASVQYWAKLELLFNVPAKHFNPKPKVDSAVIRLKIKAKTNKKSGDYYNFIRILFKQPRKTILNNLADGFNLSKQDTGAKLKKLGVDGGDRPQNLDLRTMQKIAAHIKS